METILDLIPECYVSEDAESSDNEELSAFFFDDYDDCIDSEIWMLEQKLLDKLKDLSVKYGVKAILLRDGAEVTKADDNNTVLINNSSEYTVKIISSDDFDWHIFEEDVLLDVYDDMYFLKDWEYNEDDDCDDCDEDDEELDYEDDDDTFRGYYRVYVRLGKHVML